MDAIKSIDSLIYIIDDKKENKDLWENDFGLNKKHYYKSFNLKIDHIAQTLPYNQMSSSLLSYVTLFNCKKSSIIDIIDPSGITKSQVIENKTQSFRMIMNGAENDKTIAGRFIENKKGSGIQHIAFSTDNLIKLTIKLKEKGLKFLEISDKLQI